MKLRIKSFVTVFALTLFGVFSALPANSAEPIPTPVLQDPYLPILKDLRVNVDLSAKTDSRKRLTFSAIATVDLTVKYHRNSTHAIEMKYFLADTAVDTTNCSRITQWVRVPSTSFGVKPATSSFTSPTVNLAEKLGNRKILENLKNRTKVGDWFEERFKFTTPILDNEFIEPCIARYEIGSVIVHDVAGKDKTIMYNVYLEGIDFVELNGKDSLVIPERNCPKISVSSWGEFPIPCEDTADIMNATFSITREMIDVSIAKALNPPKVVATQTAKTTTITCIKGKLTKKVTASNPKCPTGYKKK